VISADRQAGLAGNATGAENRVKCGEAGGHDRAHPRSIGRRSIGRRSFNYLGYCRQRPHDGTVPTTGRRAGLHSEPVRSCRTPAIPEGRQSGRDIGGNGGHRPMIEHPFYSSRSPTLAMSAEPGSRLRICPYPRHGYESVFAADLAGPARVCRAVAIRSRSPYPPGGYFRGRTGITSEAAAGGGDVTDSSSPEYPPDGYAEGHRSHFHGGPRQCRHSSPSKPRGYAPDGYRSGCEPALGHVGHSLSRPAAAGWAPDAFASRVTGPSRTRARLPR
jgi:hypothetical protein